MFSGTERLGDSIDFDDILTKLGRRRSIGEHLIPFACDVEGRNRRKKHLFTESMNVTSKFAASQGLKMGRLPANSKVETR